MLHHLQNLRAKGHSQEMDGLIGFSAPVVSEAALGPWISHAPATVYRLGYMDLAKGLVVMKNGDHHKCVPT